MTGLVKIQPGTIVYQAKSNDIIDPEQRTCRSCGNTSMECRDPLDTFQEHWKCTICGNEQL